MTSPSNVGASLIIYLVHPIVSPVPNDMLAYIMQVILKLLVVRKFHTE